MLSMRKAEAEDIDALCDLMTELAGHTISEKGMLNRLEHVEKSDIDYLFVCEEDGNILGLLGLRMRVNLEDVSKFGEISAIVVRPESRKKGVGRYMMNYADNLSRDMGCRECGLSVDSVEKREPMSSINGLDMRLTDTGLSDRFDIK